MITLICLLNLPFHIRRLQPTPSATGLPLPFEFFVVVFDRCSYTRKHQDKSQSAHRRSVHALAQSLLSWLTVTLLVRQEQTDHTLLTSAATRRNVNSIGPQKYLHIIVNSSLPSTGKKLPTLSRRPLSKVPRPSTRRRSRPTHIRSKPDIATTNQC